MYKGATNSYKTPGPALWLHHRQPANVINRHGTGWKSYSRTNLEQFVFYLWASIQMVGSHYWAPSRSRLFYLVGFPPKYYMCK